MAGQNNAAPVIIRRRRIGAEPEHSGGAWKIAYADFVTAMMAFFMLMWLINATTESQRKGIAEYFSPRASVSRTSGGGTDVLAGDSVLADDALAYSASGGAGSRILLDDLAGTTSPEGEYRLLEAIREELHTLGDSNPENARLLQHVVTRLSDEGLVVEMFDLPESPLFAVDSAVPEPVLRELATLLAPLFGRVLNQVAMHAHVRSYPITLINNPAWALSSARVQVLRETFEAARFDPARVLRISGFGDRKPLLADPMQGRNNRLEIVLLRR